MCQAFYATTLRPMLYALKEPAIILTGLVFAWSLVVVSHAPPLHRGASALYSGELTSPNPLTCSSGSCFDKATKFGFAECSGGNGQFVRGHTIPIGSRATSPPSPREQMQPQRLTRHTNAPDTCYKTFYMNIEPNSALLLFILFFFGSFFSRVFEHLARLALAGQLRCAAAAGLAACIFPMFYSLDMLFVYTNEHRTEMLRSQLFFAVTELLSTSILVYHSHDGVFNHDLNVVMGGIALLHLGQITYDETHAVTANIPRNILLGTGDGSVFAVSLYLLKAQTRKKAFLSMVLIAVGLGAVFRLFFMDDASVQ